MQARIVLVGILLVLTTGTMCTLETSKLVGKSFSTVSVSYCDGLGTPYFTLDSVVISGTAAPGEVTTTTFTGKTTKQWTVARTDSVTKYGIVQAGSTSDPVSPPATYPVGPLSMVSKSTLAKDPPTGGYTTTIRFIDTNNKVLECVVLSYKVV